MTGDDGPGGIRQNLLVHLHFIVLFMHLTLKNRNLDFKTETSINGHSLSADCNDYKKWKKCDICSIGLHTVKN